jgi:hypothetical protein
MKIDITGKILPKSYDTTEVNVRGDLIRSERYEIYTSVEYFCDTVCQRGMIVEHMRTTSIDGCEVKMCAPGQYGGHPIGMILQNVVDINPAFAVFATPVHDTMIGSKVEILQKGLVTVKLYSHDEVSKGADIWYDLKGYMTLEPQYHTLRVLVNDKWVDRKRGHIGKVAKLPDEDGYCKAFINCMDMIE